MNKLLLSLLVLLLAGVTFSQTDFSELKTQQDEVTRLFKIDKVKALELSEQMLPKAMESKDTNYITYFLDQSGELNRFAGNYSRALEQLNRSLEYKKGWKDLKDLSITHNNLAKTYMTLGRNESAFQHLKIALELMDRSGNKFGQGYYANNIGILFESQKNYGKAVEYYEKSRAIKKEIGDTTGYIITGFNKAICLDKIGNQNDAMSLYKEYYFFKKAIGDSTNVARACRFISSILLNKGEISESALFMNEGLRYLENQTDFRLQVNFELSKLALYEVQNNSEGAMKSIEKAKKLVAPNGLFQQKFDVFKMVSNYYHTQNQSDSAYKYLILANQYNDSILNKESIYAVNEIEGKYEYEKNLRLRQEAELTSLKKDAQLQKRNTYLIVAFAVILIAIVIIVYFVYQNRTSQKMALYKNAQNILLNKQKTQLDYLNKNLKTELRKTQISLEEQKTLLDRAFESSKELELPDSIISLSKREFEVLSNLALGLTDNELAEKMFVSKSTVKTHLRRIYSKLLVKNRAEAVAIAHKYNIIGDAGDEA